MTARPKLRFRIRIEQGEDIAVGPGKIALLEAIDAEGSITRAAKRLGMSYRRAWLLVDTMNRAFGTPVVEASQGGRAGGGALVTATGAEIVRRYRSIEATAARATRRETDALLRLLDR